MCKWKQSAWGCNLFCSRVSDLVDVRECPLLLYVVISVLYIAQSAEEWWKLCVWTVQDEGGIPGSLPRLNTKCLPSWAELPRLWHRYMLQRPVQGSRFLYLFLFHYMRVICIIQYYNALHINIEFQESWSGQVSHIKVEALTNRPFTAICQGPDVWDLNLWPRVGRWMLSFWMDNACSWPFNCLPWLYHNFYVVWLDIQVQIFRFDQNCDFGCKETC